MTVGYPSHEEEAAIVKTMGRASAIAVDKVLSAADLLHFRKLIDEVVCADKIIDYIVKIISVTRPSEKRSEHDITRYIAFGASPRASIALLQCAKARALLEGRSFVLPEDVKIQAPLVLRHRLALSYEAAADGITADGIIEKILNIVPVP